MDRVKGEPFRFDCPLFADELAGREAFEGLQSSPEVVGADEVGEVVAQLVVILVVEAFDRRVLDRAVPLPGSGLPANRERDPLNLAATRENRPPDCFLGLAAPRMLDLGRPARTGPAPVSFRSFESDTRSKQTGYGSNTRAASSSGMRFASRRVRSIRKRSGGSFSLRTA